MFRLESGGRDLFAMVVGARQCAERPATCDLSQGIVTDEPSRTVTFRLTRPDPNLLANLSYGGLAAPVPAGTPFRDTRFVPIPGTGPYRIATASRSRSATSAIRSSASGRTPRSPMGTRTRS